MEPWYKRMKLQMGGECLDRQAKQHGHGAELVQEREPVEGFIALDESAGCSEDHLNRKIHAKNRYILAARGVSTAEFQQGFAEDDGGCAKKADAASAAGVLSNELFQGHLTRQIRAKNGDISAARGVVPTAKFHQGFAEDDGGCAKKVDAESDAGVLSNELFQVRGDSYYDCKNKESLCIHPRKQCNTLRKLQLREMGLTYPSFTPELFRKVNTEQTVLDMYKYKDALQSLPALQRKRSGILQILAVKDVIVLVSITGLAAVFSRVTNKMIRVLTEIDEMTEDVFYNKDRNCIIVKSSRKSDDYIAKYFVDIPLEYIGTSKGNAIFQDEDIAWPGFVEFNATNGKALIKQSNYYQVFDLKNYSLLHKIEEMNVPTAIRFRPEALLVIHQQEDNVLHLRTHSLENGDGLDSFDHLVHTKADFVDTFHGKLLIQEMNKNFEIIDAKRSLRTEVQLGDITFVPLHRKHILFTFQDHSSEIRDLSGAVIKNLDSLLWRSRRMERRFCPTPDDDALIFVGISEDSEIGSINVCCTRSGNCISKLQPRREVTFLAYNSDTNEIYAGSARGKVYVWSFF